MRQSLTIATRNSALALWQANFVKESLQLHWPHLKIQLLPMQTSGDAFLKDKLLKIGNKGLFVKELEEALLLQQADIAVHSMKDVPAHLPEGLILDIICQREDARDVLLSPTATHVDQLPKGARVGTSSLRRCFQLLSMRQDLCIEPLRGNILRRIKKLEDGEFDAIILAAAGLARMQLLDKVAYYFPIEQLLPACGQGALGIECRQEDTVVQQWLRPLHDELTGLCVNTERALNAKLGGTCHTPIAIYADIQNEELILRAKVGNTTGQIMIHTQQKGLKSQAATVIERCYEDLISQGVASLIPLTMD